jgi:hypothetical protein
MTTSTLTTLLASFDNAREEHNAARSAWVGLSKDQQMGRATAADVAAAMAAMEPLAAAENEAIGKLRSFCIDAAGPVVGLKRPGFGMVVEYDRGAHEVVPSWAPHFGGLTAREAKRVAANLARSGVPVRSYRARAKSEAPGAYIL